MYIHRSVRNGQRKHDRANSADIGGTCLCLDRRKGVRRATKSLEKETEMKSKHRICEHCGATLDPEERCDCQTEETDDAEKKETGGDPKAA